MKMTNDDQNFDHLLEHVLDSVVNQLNKEEFQDFILGGGLRGLSFYNAIKLVKSRSGNTIWVRR